LRGGVDFPEGSDPAVRDDDLNGHWLPYWKLCTPCRNESKPHLVIKLGDSMNDEVIRGPMLRSMFSAIFANFR
jgi:hypothetical protein